jgi:hypothetical protein
VLGVKTPVDVTNVEPDQLPPEGVPVKLMAGAFKHTPWSAPALAAVGAITVTTIWSVPVQPV